MVNVGILHDVGQPWRKEAEILVFLTAPPKQTRLLIFF